MSKLQYTFLMIVFILQLLVLCNIDDNTREVRFMMIDLWNKAHKTYFIKQIPKDKLPPQKEINI